MKKKSKKKRSEPIGSTALPEHRLKWQPPPEEEKEPSFDELWRQSVEAIKKLEQDHPEAYWAKAAKVKYAPLLFPRRKSEQMEFWGTKLVEKGLRKTDAGSPFKYGEPIQSEVEGIYRSLLEEILQLHIRVKIKKTTKLKDISKEEKLLLDLPPYGPKTWKKWWPLFLSRFMNKYDGQPEQHPPVYWVVRGGIERKSEGRRKSLPADSLYREAIKNSFKQKVGSYAKQPWELRT